VIAGTLVEAAGWTEGRLRGADAAYSGVGTDSRAISPGSLYVALRGERFDAHDFLPQVMAAGAAGAVVSRGAELPLPQIEVEDTRLALGRLAAAWRAKLGVQVIAVTGSNGKTTVKEMLAAILGAQGPVLATRGNLNNDIGVPLTLLGLGFEHRSAIVEMGCSAPGEIAYLTAIVRPAVAVINNAGPAHLDGFGTVAAVARGKGEILQGLAESGVAVFNGDDPYASLWRSLAGARRSLSFGLGASCEVRGELLQGPGNRFSVHAGADSVQVDLPLPGRHNVMNALAAAAAAWAAGLSLEAVSAGLARVAGVPGRLQLRPGLGGSQLIDDSYNANPVSLRAAMQTLAGLGGRGWLVLGDMAELGEDAIALHAQAGLEACRLGLERLYALGPMSAEAAQAFDGGVRRYAELEPLVASLRDDLQRAGAGVHVLVKGSRSARMERVVSVLAAAGGER